MGVEGVLDKLLDLAVDRFQKLKIESERRKLVAKIKEAYKEYIAAVDNIVEKINLATDIFNNRIDSLNEYRTIKVKKNLDLLGMFLSQFGNLDNVDNSPIRKSQEQIEVQKKQLDKSENHIDDIDWSEGDIFEKTFFESIIDISSKTKVLSRDATKKIKEFKLQLHENKQSAENKSDYINQDIRILDMYKQSIEFISETIEQTIIPEIQLVQAFLQCDEIKNNIIANKEIELKKKNDISLLSGSIHNKHYDFVKNTFIFFLISSKVYNTKILISLLNDQKHDEEEKEIVKYNEILREQQGKLDEYMIIGGDIIGT